MRKLKTALNRYAYRKEEIGIKCKCPGKVPRLRYKLAIKGGLVTTPVGGPLRVSLGE